MTAPQDPPTVVKHSANQVDVVAYEDPTQD